MRTVTALLLALPLAAAAQVSPAPGPAPAAPAAEASPSPPPGPPAPAPYPIIYPPAPSRRDAWYIGFGVGGGSGRSTDSAAGSLPLASWVDADPVTVFLQLQAGVTLTPRLLLGGELSGLQTGSDVGGIKKSAQITNLDLMLTWFPREQGLFLRGGGGWSGFTRQQTGLGSVQAGGANLTVGGGYAFWLGRSFNLALHLDLSRQWYGSNQLALESSSYGVLWLGFDWY